ncbi:tetratricopeptide repeat protein [bacterium]|nr:tetratricopeptide repeat protein [bacterium]
MTSFFFTGMCGLIYATAWMQILRYSLGPPSISIISILVIFLAGISLGSRISGNHIDNQRDHFKLYTVLEIALGIYSLFIALLIKGVAIIYGAIYQNIRLPFYTYFLLRYLLYTPILLIPSALIGAALPVAGKLLILTMDHNSMDHNRMDNAGCAAWAMGKGFGISALGGAFGALTAQFLLFPYLGAILTIYICAAINIITGITIFILCRNGLPYKAVPEQAISGESVPGVPISEQPAPEKQPISEQPAPEKSISEQPASEESSSGKTDKKPVPEEKDSSSMAVSLIVITGYAVSCFAAMIYMGVWLKAMIIFLESSFFAISLISSAFLLGAALGSLVFVKFIDNRGVPMQFSGNTESVNINTNTNDLKNKDDLTLGQEKSRVSFSGNTESVNINTNKDDLTVGYRRDPISFLGIISMAAGLSFLLIIPILDAFPLLMAFITNRYDIQSFRLLQLSKFSLFFLIILIPSLLLGLSFPLACQICSGKKFIGRPVSTAFSFSAAGCAKGILIGGILLGIWIEAKRGALLAVFAHILIGCLFLLLGFLLENPSLGFSCPFANRRFTGVSSENPFRIILSPFLNRRFMGVSLARIKKTAVLIAVALAFIFFTLFIPLWEMPLFKAEPFQYSQYSYYSGGSLNGTSKEMSPKGVEKIFSKKGIIANIALIKEKEEISLQINGVMECSVASDLPAQVLSAHIPLLLHGNPEDILLIGIGTGITLGSIERYPVRKIDCIETSQAMIQASGYFHEINHNALEDPRLNIIIGDGRHHIMFTDIRYDVIIAQPFTAWPDAMNEYFTGECFQHLRDRLKSGGIAAIRLPIKTGMKPEVFQSIIFTWNEVFPDAQLWEIDLGDSYLLAGSDRKIIWDYPVVANRLEKGEILADLERLKIKDPPFNLLSFYVMDREGIGSCCVDGKILTDRLAQSGFFLMKIPSLHFHPTLRTGDLKIEGSRMFPVNLRGRETQASLLEGIQEYRGKGILDIFIWPPGIDLSASQIIREKMDNAQEAKRYLANAYIDLINNEPKDRILKGLTDSLRKNPDDRKAIEIYSGILLSMADDYMDQGQFNWALSSASEIIRVMPDNKNALRVLGRAYYNMGLLDKAIEGFEKLTDYWPDDEEGRCYLGMAYLNKGWIDLSMVQFDHAIRIDPDYSEPHLYLGAAYFKKDLIEQAIKEYGMAIALKHDYADAHYNLGIAFLKKGMIDEAIAEWKEVIRIRPDDVNSRYNLAMAHFNHGEIEQSIALLKEVLNIKPEFQQARRLLQMLDNARQSK